jgi:hypothetical protein
LVSELARLQAETLTELRSVAEGLMLMSRLVLGVEVLTLKSAFALEVGLAAPWLETGW